MGKKKRKQQAGWGEPGYGGMQGMGAAGMGMGGAAGMGANATGAYGAADAGGAGPGLGNGLLHNLQGLVGNRQTEQFVIGALLGAAAVYVLGDEAMRTKLMKTAMKLYAGVAGGFEEVKEQMADIKAEVAAEQRSKG